jgi:hypothetical protein
MKMTSGVDFTKIVCAAFMQEDPKSAKNTDKPSVFCAFGIFSEQFKNTFFGVTCPLGCLYYF